MPFDAEPDHRDLIRLESLSRYGFKPEQVGWNQRREWLPTTCQRD
jgi:hypothetical protein